jgi:hypothetical protein
MCPGPQSSPAFRQQRLQRHCERIEAERHREQIEGERHREQGKGERHRGQGMSERHCERAKGKKILPLMVMQEDCMVASVWP